MPQKPLELRSVDQRTVDLDFSALLDDDETIASVTTVAFDGSGAPAVGSHAVNGSPVTYKDGTTAAAGKVVQVLVGPTTPPTGSPWFTLRAKVVTTKDPAVEGTVRVQVRDTIT
jgi:hypothetical protein